ncbi:hypothetical protein KY331_01955 [Candidatus Woesearchaeota archaeon]|nr:hypothetical protein [Candidatus Woesearchaeota archaeon]
MKTKKAQLGQVFIYIFAAVLAVSIMLYGYRTIRGFGQRTEQIGLVRFKTDLESEIRTIASDYGSVKKVELPLPSKYTKVCFVDFSKPIGVVENSKVCKPGNPDFNPIGCDAWKDQTQNIFLVPWTDFVIKTGEIDITEPDGALCVPTLNNRITLRLEGLGDRTQIEKWPEPQQN